MTCAGAALLIFPRAIARMYTPDEDVIHATAYLLAAGAAFQLFDGIQTVATGALRGAGDTRTPMLCHLIAYWIIGLPLGYWLCFHLRLGRLRPLGRPKPRPDPDRRSPPPNLAPHDPPPRHVLARRQR